MPKQHKKGKVAIFPTCLVDMWRPKVAEAALKLVREAGFQAEIPGKVTCCGQVTWNSGDLKGARKLARSQIEALAPYKYVVVPSGSCAGTIINQYPALFEKESAEETAAKEISAKTHELTAFLAKIAKWKPKEKAEGARNMAYQDSCSCFRELGLCREPRALLKKKGYDVKECDSPDQCCGFGGLFAVKYGEISARLAEKKTADIKKTRATLMAGADLGCLLNLAGKFIADGEKMEVRHIAELLADMSDEPAIGKARKS